MKNKFEFEKQNFSYENDSIINQLFYGILGTETFFIYVKKKLIYLFILVFLNLPILESSIKNVKINVYLLFKDYKKKLKWLEEIKIIVLIVEKIMHIVIIFLWNASNLFIHPARKNKRIRFTVEITFNKQYLNIKEYISSNMLKIIFLIN